MKDKRITLGENNRIFLDESGLVHMFSKHFRYIVQNLGIDGLTNICSDNNTAYKRTVIEKYQNYPSITVITLKH